MNVRLINKIKNYFAIRNISKLHADYKNNVIVCNINNAKSIGIIYDATKEEDFKIIREYVQKLKEFVPEVQSLGYADIKKLENFHIQPKEFAFFCKKDINWYGKPKTEAIIEFVIKDFDILIDLNPQEIIPLRFVLAESAASFKVGRKPERLDDLYHLMLEVKPDVDLKYLIEQINHYLEIINKKQ